jgi:ubiquinone/menaquinone biosynthesis C-methylase UbiE/uncharacterized protein YbaR (Trm112 family)
MDRFKIMTTVSSYKESNDIFICPMSGQRLTYLNDHDLLKWNDLIARAEVTDLNGNPINDNLEQAFITEDEKLLYPIRQNILMILPECAYILGTDTNKWRHDISEAKIQQVKEFYDDFGWESDGQNYKDANDSEDLRDVSKTYINKCHERVNKYLPKNGKYLLDIASGPVQYQEYIDYSKNYKVRICADISVKALKLAQNRIGDNGLYVLCDVTKLPFKTNSLDACISLHTLYHVPKQEQLRAFAQLHRVLKPSGQAIVVYSWGKNSFLMKCCLGPLKIIHKLIKVLSFNKTNPALYFHAYDYGWFVKTLKKRFDIDLHSWRSINVPFMKIFVHQWFGGEYLLRLFFKLEDKYPKLMGRIGAYPIFVIKKSSAVYKEPHSV